MIPVDVEKFIVRRFEAADRPEALALLEAAIIHDGSRPVPRLLRCAAVASGGSMERLRMEIETLKHDYRGTHGRRTGSPDEVDRGVRKP